MVYSTEAVHGVVIECLRAISGARRVYCMVEVPCAFVGKPGLCPAMNAGDLTSFILGRYAYRVVIDVDAVDGQAFATL